MYEKVWSGDVDGYEISLDFIEHRGLFRYTAKKDGVLISDRLCADPVDAGLMDGPGVMYNFQTPFVPNGSEIEFEGLSRPSIHPRRSRAAPGSPPPTGRKTARGRRSRNWIAA